MTRNARIVVPGSPHHVMQRGNRRERVFFEDGNYELYRDWPAQSWRKFGVSVWAYRLMPNHAHLGSGDALLNPLFLRPSLGRSSVAPGQGGDVKRGSWARRAGVKRALDRFARLEPSANRA
jgi:hypothetical protein